MIDGAKRWIGGADVADVLAIFARDSADRHVKAYLVPSEAEGVVLHRIRWEDVAAPGCWPT